MYVYTHINTYIHTYMCNLRLGLRGIRSLAVAKTVPGDVKRWEFLGLLTFLDPPRPDTKQVGGETWKSMYVVMYGCG